MATKKKNKNKNNNNNNTKNDKNINNNTKKNNNDKTNIKNNKDIKKNTEIELSIKIGDKDMFYFMLGHVYSKLSSKITLLFSVVCLILFPISFLWKDTFMTLVLLFGALTYLVISPLMLYLQSKKQVATNPVFKEPILYKINDEGFYVSQAGEWIEFLWENLYKVVQRKYNILFYISKDQAFIIPVRLIEDGKNIVKIKQMVSNKMDTSRYKFTQEKNEGKI
ncbi:YcxB family protein [Vallitalea guaymasensis]|uniref:YcxB family protein n=1 Tax=Vallitalea guaymasensis TaxID=1185412 RepID=A0A8J8MC19_9FIRM|nr:YcxB family protein [Vallitalea guaymasensis]QUH30197.1 YcxB family protein [Vallitalea guaymasensis]